MNPYVLLGLGLAWLLSLIGVGTWQHGAGEDAQKIADQAQFDGINKKLVDQKTEANTLYRSAQAEIIALLGERDQFKTRLEKEHADHQAATTALRDKYAGLGLRFRSTQTPGCRLDSPSTVPTGTDTASTAAAQVVQLPDAIAADLRRLNYDADELNNDYRLCYDYATGVK